MEIQKRLVSIVVPLFNSERFIADTIQSCLDQSCKNWELIVIDDNSSDGSLAIVESFTKNNDNIKLYSNTTEKKGANTCRNIGIKKAKGEYILFLDSDDLLHINCIKRRIAYSETKSGLDFYIFTIGSFYKVVGDCNYLWNSFSGNHLEKFLLHELPWHTSSPLWNKQFLLDAGGFNESFQRLQDVELHTRILLQNPSYEICNENSPDVFYRIDEHRISGDYIEFVKKWKKGAIDYISLFLLLIKEKKYKKSLKGTFFEILKQINTAYISKKISRKNYKKLVKGFFRELNQVDENIFRSFFLIKLYNYLFVLGLYKIKGFNYLFKKIYIYY